MSSTSLAVEDNEEGRMSPISPIIERFNSKVVIFLQFIFREYLKSNKSDTFRHRNIVHLI